MTTNKYFVVAGNRQQYEYFIRKKSEELWKDGVDITLSNFVYATTDSLKGFRDPHGWFYGTWRDRPDIAQLLIHLIMQTTDDKTSQIFQKLANELIEERR